MARVLQAQLAVNYHPKARKNLPTLTTWRGSWTFRDTDRLLDFFYDEFMPYADRKLTRMFDTTVQLARSPTYNQYQRFLHFIDHAAAHYGLMRFQLKWLPSD